MQDIQYIGEHLLPGQLGHFFILTAFVSALLSIVSYHKLVLLPGDLSWQRLSRAAWGIHSFSILAVIGILFYIMIGQMYEYKYAWDHVSDDLPMKYIFSAFWEGQEGSFLLWMFWHVVLGSIVVFTAKRWEAGVMTWLSVVQLVLVSMIAGVYFADDFRMGSSPFLMLRDTMEAPIFNNANYLSLIEGNGLNPLLQNYWMTIHPPTLFLGFASVTIPFCFAMTGLWEKDHTAWLKPVMPWTLFSTGILGLGILMGGAWAYEALSFGGYWAWDPVENMSLVPWLVLLAAMHGNFIARHTGQTIKTTYIFYILSFLLVVYSTFLTRSGILGEESVHAFTEMGLEWQLVGFIGIFGLAGLYFLLTRNKSIPVVEKEEKIQSREFWMFVGAMVLVFASVLITFTTSIPVWNKLIDVYGSLMGKGDMTPYHKAMPLDPIDHHNRFQLWNAVLIAIMASMAQVLRFGAMGWETHKSRFLKHVLISTGAGLAFAFLLSLWIELPSWQYIVLLIAASFGVVSNIDYIISFGRTKLTAMASAFAHGGFALMLLGIMASGLNKRIISENKFAQEGLVEGMDAGQNAFLIKDMPMYMNGYWVTYKSDTLEGLTRKYEVEFVKVSEKGDTVEHFTTHPNILYDRKLSKVETANPNTKRYLDRDVFTFISGLPPEQQDRENLRKVDDTLDYQLHFLTPGQFIYSGKYKIQLDSLQLTSLHKEYEKEEGDLVVSGILTVSDSSTQQTSFIHPTLIVRKGLLYSLSDQVNNFNLRARLKATALDTILPLDEALLYEPMVIKSGESKKWKDLTITMQGIDKNVDHPNYTPAPDDIAIQAVLDIKKDSGQNHIARPLYFIREGAPLNMKSYLPDLGLHIKLEKIDPVKEEFHLQIARLTDTPKLPVEIALDAPRNDFIVLEAILFPGINLFWAGSLLMLLGMFIGMYKRLKKS
jgi:cytochrome c-type biogenesis protein CcmF